MNLINARIGCRNKYKVVSDLANNNFGIIISAKTVKRWIDRWSKTNKLADRPRDNRAKLIIEPFIPRRKII